jgi:hypothetical protein
LKGHGFSRAANVTKSARALAPEGCFFFSPSQNLDSFLQTVQSCSKRNQIIPSFSPLKKLPTNRSVHPHRFPVGPKALLVLL